MVDIERDNMKVLSKAELEKAVKDLKEAREAFQDMAVALDEAIVELDKEEVTEKEQIEAMAKILVQVAIIAQKLQG